MSLVFSLRLPPPSYYPPSPSGSTLAPSAPPSGSHDPLCGLFSTDPGVSACLTSHHMGSHSLMTEGQSLPEHRPDLSWFHLK